MPISHKIIIASVLLSMTAAASAHGHNVFKTALAEKYNFRSVSCYACHLHRDQTAEFSEAELAEYKENPKAFYTELGKRFQPHLAEKMIAERVERMDAAKKAARAADSEEMEAKLKAEAERIEAELIEDIDAALDKIAAEKDSDAGKTYDDLLKAGEIEGVRLPQ